MKYGATLKAIASRYEMPEKMLILSGFMGSGVSLSERVQFYADTDIRIDTDGKSVEDVGADSVPFEGVF